MAERTSTSRRRSSTTPTAPTRLPSSRERRPAMAALAVLLIVGGALASGWLALRSGHRADYLVMQTDVAQGEQIDQGDLDVVSLPDDLADEYVVASRREEVVGQEATTPLRPGMVLTDDFFDEDVGPAEDESQQPLEIEGGIPEEMSDGSSILIYLTNVDPETDQVTAVKGTVVNIDRPAEGEGGISGATGSAVTTMTVSIPAECGGEVALASSDGEFRIGLIDPTYQATADLHPCVPTEDTATNGSETTSSPTTGTD